MLKLADDPTKTKVTTRDGRPAEIYAVKEGQAYALLGAVFEGDYWRMVDWTLDGQCIAGRSDYDTNLINAPEPPVTVERWVNVYPKDAMGGLERSKNACDGVAEPNRIACVPVQITYRPGEGLEGA